jgi:adenylosuccinate synthase
VDVDRLSIDPQAMVITQAHQEAEGGLTKSIGSTGQGVGLATAGRIIDRKPDLKVLAKDVEVLKPYLRPAFDVLDDAYRAGERVFVEGTQGTGLSLLHGPYPYVTSRDTTASGLLAEAGIAPGRVRRVVMVCRTHPIRVQSPEGGTSGPMSNEISWELVAERAGLDVAALREQEKTTTTKRERRVSEFDWDLLYRASRLNEPTDIAITFTDQIDAANVEARRYEQLTPDTIRFIEEVEQVGAAPVTLVSTRFHRRSIIDRRSW